MHQHVKKIHALNEMAKTNPFFAAKEAIALLAELHTNSGSYQKAVLSPSVEAFKSAIEILETAIKSIYE